MFRDNIRDYLFKFLGVLVTITMVIYILPPVNFASAVGYATWRNIYLSTAAPGFTPTTLSAAISSTGATTMSVNSSANYPTPPFVISIGSVGTEAIEVTAINGTTWTIVRGYGGTTAITYLVNATVSGPSVYSVSFVPATPATSIQAIVVDFCTDSPIYNSSTCVTPTGMTIGASSATSLAVSGISGISASLFNTSYTKANNSSRNDILIGNNGTGYVPLTTTALASPYITTTGQTTFNVASSASYPAASSTNPSSWFYVTIPLTGETMQVTNVSGTVWTVNRGALGTTAAIANAADALSQPPIGFNINGVMNPTTVGSFYARLYTFSTYSTASTFAAASPITGTSYSTAASVNIDSGGVALEIVSVLTITAKVQEYLQFCIYTASGASTGCNLGGSSVNLGNSSSILSISNAYVDSSTRFDVATNASGYVAITFTGAPLTNGSLVIENSSLSGTGTVAVTSYQSVVGTDQFGMCAIALASQPTNFSSAGLSFPNNTYNNASCPSSYGLSATYAGSAYFGLNIAQADSVYGDLLATQKPGPEASGVISFLGNVAPSQLAGVYSTTFNFVASGTY